MTKDNKNTTISHISVSDDPGISEGTGDKERKTKKILAFVKLGFLLLLVVGIPAYIWFFQHQLIDSVSSVEKVQTLLNSNKMLSIPIYIGAQILQIIICIIPGQWLQMGAGLAWGFWLGYLYSLIGAAIGSFLTYYIAKWLGKDGMYFIFGKEKMDHYVEKLRSRKAIIIVFFIFLIPGVPKDLCNYAAGVSEMKLRPFLVASLLGRTPGMMGSLLIGRNIGASSYMSAIIIAVIALVLFVLGVIYHKRIFAAIESRQEKHHNASDTENENAGEMNETISQSAGSNDPDDAGR
jgi:uncharacterized membrane protein YdjX (TVP38/TMEM64 family)